MSVHTLYRCYSSDDALLYVGLTVNPGRRMEKHRGKDWWADVARITMEQHPNLESLRAAERAAIQAEQPRHNIRMNGGSLQSAGNGATDGFVGKWFHSWRDDDGQRKPVWQGQITSQADDDFFFIQLYSWWDGCANGGEQLVTREDMREWTFYASPGDMQIALGCREDFGPKKGAPLDSGVCRNPVTHVIRNWCGQGAIYRCWRCIEFYSGTPEEL